MKNILDVEVSSFANFYDKTNPVTVNLYDWLRSDKYREEVIKIRTLTSKADRDAEKAKLPATTVSGLFSERSGCNLIKHSGLICVDIDYKDNVEVANFNDMKTQLSNLSNIAYCGLSVSGNGYFAIIPIAYPTLHNEHFKSLKKDFELMGITIDKLCGDVTRLRGYSWDDKPYFNLDAKPYKSIIKPHKIEYAPYKVADVDNAVEVLISKICTTQTNIAESYNDWFAVGCAIASEFWENGRAMFHAVSRQSSKYDAVKCDRQYDKCLRDKRGYTIKTFFAMCKDNNITFK